MNMFFNNILFTIFNISNIYKWPKLTKEKIVKL